MNEFLTDLKVKCCGANLKDTLQEIKKIRSFDGKFTLFYKITGEELSKQVQNISKPYWDNWVYVRRKRNDFVHGKSYAIGWEICERAFKLTKDSVSVFSALNNTFVANKSG